jgi:creatinine amidohydrolase
MTWLEVEEAVSDSAVVLVPMGTVEVQGRHAPMGYDFILAERVAEAVAERAGCLVAPTLPFGYSHFSWSFPGTISLRPETLRGVISDLSESLVRSGFRHILFLNNHGLNEPILGHVAERVGREQGLDLFSIQPSKLAQDLGADLYEHPEVAFSHGGEPTISLMLYLVPECVRRGNPERLEWGSYHGKKLVSAGRIEHGHSTLRVYSDFRALAPTGGMGDATQASREKGRIMFERMVEYLVEFVEEYGGMDTSRNRADESH